MAGPTLRVSRFYVCEFVQYSVQHSVYNNLVRGTYSSLLLSVLAVLWVVLEAKLRNVDASPDVED